MEKDSRQKLGDEELAVQLAEIVSRLSRRLRRSSARWLSPYGLTDSQARVLRIVGRGQPFLRMSDIARRIEVVPRSATTVVEGLERKGLVVREIDPTDRRSILVRPTEQGSRVLFELGRARDEAAASLFGHLGKTERLELLRLLSALRSGDDAGAPPHRRQHRARVGEVLDR